MSFFGARVINYPRLASADQELQFARFGVRLDIGLAVVLAISVVEPGLLLTGVIALLLPLAAGAAAGGVGPGSESGRAVGSGPSGGAEASKFPGDRGALVVGNSLVSHGRTIEQPGRGTVAALSLIKGECVGILSRFGLDPVGPEAPAGSLGLIGGPGDDAEVVSRAGHAWVELECGAQRLHGVGGSARLGQQESEVEERRGVVRLDLQGPAEARLGAVGLVQVAICERGVDERADDPRLELRGRLELVDGLGEGAAL